MGCTVIVFAVKVISVGTLFPTKVSLFSDSLLFCYAVFSRWRLYGEGFCLPSILYFGCWGVCRSSIFCWYVTRQCPVGFFSITSFRMRLPVFRGRLGIFAVDVMFQMFHPHVVF